jgi:subtilisin
MTPVGSPANCPSVLAVAAVNDSLQRSSFSCIATNPDGGELNIAAPGERVFSSVPAPALYGVKSGTSMATPHVSGIAALIAEATGLRGKALWQKLVKSTRDIGLPVEHAGSGLVQAP